MVRELPLSKGFVAIIDDEDFAQHGTHKWCASTSARPTAPVYAMRWDRSGAFADPAEAARAWDKAALELRGEYARLNFPIEADQ